MVLSEFQKGIQRRLESQKVKKRNLNPPEGISNSAQTEKEEKGKKEAKKRRFLQHKPIF